MMSVMAVRGNDGAQNSSLSVLQHAWGEVGSDLHPLNRRRLYEISCVSQDVCILFQVPKK